MKILNKTLLVTALTITSASVMASNVKFSGFGTLGYSQNDEKDIEVDHVPSKGSWGKTSLLGLQANAKITSNLFAVAQVKLSEDATIAEKMQMTLEMAFLGYEVSDSLKVRVGRLRAPFYLDSEYLDVGYLRKTAITPLAVYGQAPFLNYNGVDAIFTHYTDSDLEFQIQPYIAREQEEVDLPGGKMTHEMAGVNVSVARNDWKVRAGYTVGEMDLSGFQVPASQSNLLIDGDVGSFVTVGASYDDGTLLVVSEFARKSVENALRAENLTGAYLTVGYRVSDFTPYFIYQAQKTDEKNRAIGVNGDFNALSLGGRYDFDKVVVKVEVTSYEFGENGAYGYENLLTGYETTTLKSANTLNLTLETVF